ncbi:hypothetical protein O181_080884 [Austropuccinia psidii MF-1]|uniref:GH26 domain-containing protein n=1 Tax=Austropuccinia psidii MF-1 TaxID=1389203 RepID=A0A9Q3FLA2_9BASI|nr:hypothetical protein [Austropuccinia psidii MF-1]
MSFKTHLPLSISILTYSFYFLIYLILILSNSFHLIKSQQIINSIQNALNERDQIYFGIWTDSQSGFSDTPALINSRLGLNISAFQIAQQIPLPKYNYTTGAGGPAPEYLIEQTQTDAAVFLTVYPTSIDAVADSDLNALGIQLASYKNDLNRTVFLRFAPEMQGAWNPYGFQPTAFLALWKRMYTIIKSTSNSTAIVWAPNTPQSYPYSQSTNGLSTADLSILDTNHDGQINNDDDPFTPFYPGDEFVDWIGISSYYKGPTFQNINVPQPSGYCGSVLNGTLGSNYNWYELFCNKPGKACMIAESGAAFHLQAIDNQASTAKNIIDLQRAWWQDCITSTDFFRQFPRVKMTMHFEHLKMEVDGGKNDLRDYRLTNDTATLEAFKADLTSVIGSYVVAGYRPLPANVQASGRPTSSPGVTKDQNQTGIVFQTERKPLVTGPPTLFGNRKGSGSKNFEFSGLSLMTGLMGACLGVKLVIR